MNKLLLILIVTLTWAPSLWAIAEVNAPHDLILSQRVEQRRRQELAAQEAQAQAKGQSLTPDIPPPVKLDPLAQQAARKAIMLQYQADQAAADAASQKMSPSLLLTIFSILLSLALCVTAKTLSKQNR